MTDVLFYQLDARPLEAVLPKLLEKTLERGWRAVVQTGNEERVEALVQHLWTYDEAGFLPHGSSADGHPEQQPVWLTAGSDRPNGAAVRFLVDGATLDHGTDDYERIVYIFDGRDGGELERAREDWKSARAQGYAVTYWQQTAAGGWERKA